MKFQNTMKIDDEVYGLDYNVTKEENGTIVLSVSKVYGNKIVDISTVSVSPVTFESMIEFADVMCRNTVTPMGLRDVVTDLICEKIIVK